MEQEKRSKVNPTQSMRDAMKKATTEMLVLFMLRQKPMYTSRSKPPNTRGSHLQYNVSCCISTSGKWIY